MRRLYAWACWLHAAWWIKRYSTPTCATMGNPDCCGSCEVCPLD